MNSLKRLYNAAVVPVVVLDDAADAVPTAKALLAGGVDVMEITFRTAAAADSITAVAKECPDMFVGFAPKSRGAHTPQEHLYLDTMEPFWKHLTALLASLCEG